MGYFAKRMRQKRLQEREAEGENLWRPYLDTTARRKIVYAIFESIRDSLDHKLLNYRDDVLYEARRRVIVEEGLPHLTESTATPVNDILSCLQGDEYILTFSCLEAIVEVMRFGELAHACDPDGFVERLNNIFVEHRASFEFIDGQVVPFESRELHTEVVAPTMTLLANRSGWEDVESAYQEALEEIGDDPKDAITDAARALQEALTLLGCEGNSLGPLISDARDKGLLGPHDSKLSEGVEKFMDWVSADRSVLGDTHANTDADRHDAWLAVHVVGALILRLANR